MNKNKIFIFKCLFVLSVLVVLIGGQEEKKAYAQACGNITGGEYVNCAGNSTTINGTTPYGHFSNSAVGTAGTLSVACYERVENTSQRFVTYWQLCPPTFGPCEATTGTANEVACNPNILCGNGIKDEYECCDGGPDCNAGCQCIFSQNLSEEISGFCGDGICEGGEDATNCSQDCSASSCTSDEMPGVTPGPTNVIIYQGDSGSIRSTIYDRGGGSGSVMVGYVFNSCPEGAVCTGETGYEYVEDPETGSATTIVNTSNSTIVGNYPILVRYYNDDKPVCQETHRFNLIIKPSRRTVCNGNWYEIAPGTPVASLGGGGVYHPVFGGGTIFFGYTNQDKYYEQNCTYGAYPTCTWYTDFYQTYQAPQQITEGPFLDYGSGAPFYPADAFTIRYKFADGNTYRRYPHWGSGFTFGEGVSNYDWGSPNTTLAKNGLEYSFRKNGSGVYEYSCIAPVVPDITATPASVNLNGASTISWTSTNATSCAVTCTSGSCPWTGISGSQSSGALVADRTYTLTCQPGNVVDNVTVSVIPNASPDITATPNSVITGNASTISWTSTNATSCAVTCTSGSCPWTGTTGSQSSGALVADRTYTLTCQPGNVTDDVTVVVTPSSYRLNVNKSGQGIVTSSVGTPSINCGFTCQADYTPNDPVTLNATPVPGRIFTGWSGACSGRAACNLIMDSNKSVTANFAVDPNYREF